MTIYFDLFWTGFCFGVFGAAALFVGLIIYFGIASQKKKGK